MVIKRLKPTVKKLGYIRFWRDDLAEVIALTQDLENIDIALEVDDCELDDLDADLPKLGPRVRNIALRVARTLVEGSEPSNVMTMYLPKNDVSRLEATNPDIRARAVMASIEEYVSNKRRVPQWFPRMNGKSTWANIWSLLALLSAAWFVIVLYNVAEGFKVKGGYTIPWLAAISLDVVALAIIITTSIGTALSRNLLYTGTQSQAPTFWQKNRAGITINVLVAAVFYLLGTVTPHF